MSDNIAGMRKYGRWNFVSCKSRGEVVEHIHVNRAGVTLGVVLAGWHVVWLVAVAAGVAQPLVNFVFWIHLMEADAAVGGFALMPAIWLVVVAFAAGYLTGATLAAVWNGMGWMRSVIATKSHLPSASKPAGMS